MEWFCEIVGPYCYWPKEPASDIKPAKKRDVKEKRDDENANSKKPNVFRSRTEDPEPGIPQGRFDLSARELWDEVYAKYWY